MERGVQGSQEHFVHFEQVHAQGSRIVSAVYRRGNRTAVKESGKVRGRVITEFEQVFSEGVHRAVQVVGDH